MINERYLSSSLNRRWMIVDDDEDVLGFLACALRRIGVEDVVAVADAGTALMLFTTEPDAFQAVLTDFNMPLMNGDELCHRLHAIAPELNVFLMTGNGSMTSQAADRNGFAGLLRKPFSLEELRSLLGDVQDGSQTGDARETLGKNSLNFFFQKRAAFTIA